MIHHSLVFPLPPEYKEIDSQLDQIDAVLSVLESRQQTLHQEAQQLLVDARAARGEGQGGGSKEEKCSDSDLPEK